ncbi:acetylpolyamine aminohydrolase [Fluoribacter gormanii]|uniref:Acetoin utilization deacetylase AcuC n=1 Tax=Fluoribacter gormanii TaxID=464 RepID=A0A377GLU1_9GAMM|nr:acetylpolyamine aminohydrolase [Fluoribacter gormanii]KTD05634.1 acetylpolyamine aminohydrolase [Fluoribacter gormanii]MCW8442582.1 acetylpolyamine aminohydrolase [Fluoribacter gormanii]MCW8471072.1 acetylpolyamine aminohydrolase [Fluoribacter gormanii]SIQ66297.1 Acetoin utilization deacetylase AcuC [Fluoribacter gormanii]STO25809.1 Deacetylases, including yeast histone deacetylase and acetoin utilization protein [Fluoribacter gormanii]
MKHKYFFGHKVSHTTDNAQECCIQIPSPQDIEQMHAMPAGADEDQFERLTNMIRVIAEIQSTDSSLSVATTDLVTLPKHWNQLFAAMKKGDAEAALALLGQFPEEDVILQALLAVHTLKYLQELIIYCVQAQKKGWKQLSPDILITPGAFEVLIKDIAMTLFHSGKMHFSFGLPTHHAYSDEGSGFCILNKSAVLIKYLQHLSSKPLKHIIVGTDVNRDNGLCDILMNSASDMDIRHIDIFDSRVYPQQDGAFITKAFKQSATDAGQKIQLWQRGNFEYFAVDLSLTLRKSGSVHPALVFALEKIKDEIKLAKTNQQKVALFLPTGWDSHEEETAYCGKFVDGHLMGRAEARKTRFNATDLTYFYENLFKIYQENKSSIEKVYWGLEGGYAREMYEQQIQLLMSLVLKDIVHQDTNEVVPDSPKNF